MRKNVVAGAFTWPVISVGDEWGNISRLLAFILDKVGV